MIALYILAAILGLAFLAAFLPVTLTIDYQKGFRVSIQTFFISWLEYPRKKEKVNLKHYRKKKKRKISPAASSPSPAPKEDLRKDFSFLKILFTTLGKKGWQFAKLKIARIHIVIGTQDAAETAILYGAVRGGMAICLEILNSLKRHCAAPEDDITVIPDFTADTSTVDFKVIFSMYAWQALYLLFCISLEILKSEKEIDKN